MPPVQAFYTNLNRLPSLSTKTATRVFDLLRLGDIARARWGEDLGLGKGER